MNIQWYPGHMTKTRRQMEEDVKFVDMVAEVVDVRIPISSRNPDIDAMVGDRPRMMIFNRADQADPEQTARWLARFRAMGFAVLAIIHPPLSVQTRSPPRPAWPWSGWSG